MEVEWKRIRSDVSGGWKGTSQGAGGREEEGQEGSHTMTYHDNKIVAKILHSTQLFSRPNLACDRIMYPVSDRIL